jgi:hypothetical protein
MKFSNVKNPLNYVCFLFIKIYVLQFKRDQEKLNLYHYFENGIEIMHEEERIRIN